MCDSIIMPDGSMVDSIREDGYCLCWSDQKDIITWIGANVRNLEYDEQLVIRRDPCNWEVEIQKFRDIKELFKEKS